MDAVLLWMSFPARRYGDDTRHFAMQPALPPASAPLTSALNTHPCFRGSHSPGSPSHGWHLGTMHALTFFATSGSDRSGSWWTGGFPADSRVVLGSIHLKCGWQAPSARRNFIRPPRCVDFALAMDLILSIA